MINLQWWFYPFIEENDIEDFKCSYKLAGKTDLENLKRKYMSIDNVENTVLVFPNYVELVE